MRLLYITNQICGSGGLERVLSIKASYLADVLGYEVHIITLNQGNQPLFYQFSTNLIYHDIKLYGNFVSYSFRYFQNLKNILKQINPDIISVCDDGLKGMLLPFFLGKKIPKIYERHVSKNIEVKTEMPSLLQRIRIKIVFALMLKGASKYDKFIVLTNGNRNEWDLENLMVISNPLSFYPQNPSNLDQNNVLAVGRHAFQKGYDRLLISWKDTIKKHSDWQLNIFGKIDSDKVHIKEAQRLNIQDSVHFHEPIKNIQDKYREASLYVMPSRYEGFGMVLIEAMAFGLPCISFNCPYGPSDIITDGVDGFLIENGDIQAFADKMALLMENSNLRAEMGANAREKAKIYLLENIMPIWDTLFKSLVYV